MLIGRRKSLIVFSLKMKKGLFHPDLWRTFSVRIRRLEPEIELAEMICISLENKIMMDICTFHCPVQSFVVSGSGL